MRKKILFAVGGTGGHLFPAQALARDLKLKVSQIEILFGGGRLGSNLFFNKLQFPFREITSGSPFRSNPIKAALQIGRGVMESLDLIKEFSPDLIVGFGSFYSLPILTAARLKNIPYVVVNSDVIPGRVNRLFSSKALFSAIQYKETAQRLKGKSIPAKMPFWMEGEFLAQADARKYYQLDPECFTLLAFGGSQGAEVINKALAELKLEEPFQVIHLCGRNQDAEALIQSYQKRGIRAAVKPFEDQMNIAWRAADLAICRAGAGTLAEIERFQVPAILIPWPGATDLHQHKNAKVMEEIGGAILLDQSEIEKLPAKIQEAKQKLEGMQSRLKDYFAREVESLDLVILNCLESLK